MNLSSAGAPEKDLLYAGFNQDLSCLTVGTRKGYRLFHCDPFKPCHLNDEGGTSAVEMLFCTSLIVRVGSGEQAHQSPRRVQVANTKRQSVICELPFQDSVLAVRVNRKRLVAVLEERVHVFDIGNMKLVHTILTPWRNPLGLCALSPNSDASYLAYPFSSTTGEFVIFDTMNSESMSVIAAHETPISAMAFNYTGTLLATASQKGTVIRVWSVPEGKKILQFRRGTYAATVFSLSFDIHSRFLTCCSDSDTVHVFRLVDEQEQQEEKRNQGYLSYAMNFATSYLPTTVADMWSPYRNHAFAKLPCGAGKKGVCALVNTGGGKDEQPLLMVVLDTGTVYQFKFDVVNGGECTLDSQHSVLGDMSIEELPMTANKTVSRAAAMRMEVAKQRTTEAMSTRPTVPTNTIAPHPISTVTTATAALTVTEQTAVLPPHTKGADATSTTTSGVSPFSSYATATSSGLSPDTLKPTTSASSQPSSLLPAQLIPEPATAAETAAAQAHAKQAIEDKALPPLPQLDEGNVEEMDTGGMDLEASVLNATTENFSAVLSKFQRIDSHERPSDVHEDDDDEDDDDDDDDINDL